jgi:hypothetical protein
LLLSAQHRCLWDRDGDEFGGPDEGYDRVSMMIGEKSTIDIAAAPISAPQISDLKLGDKVTDDLMSNAPSAPLAHVREFRALLRLPIRATTYAKAGAGGDMSDRKGSRGAT